MELKNIQKIEDATRFGRREMFRIGSALIFVAVVMLYASTINVLDKPFSIELVVAAMIGGYMAMNIGANDVANNVGPAVGSKALTLAGAIIIAGIFEAAGALIAGGDVVSTIKKGIIDPALIPNGDVFVWLMMAALLAGALWLNMATAIGAPVSTTHSIVGGVLGAGFCCRRLGDCKLGNDGKNSGKLDNLARARRDHRRSISLLDQAFHHLQKGHDQCCQKDDAHTDCNNGHGV